jgi:release factor glutamine methyltransferase
MSAPLVERARGVQPTVRALLAEAAATLESTSATARLDAELLLEIAIGMPRSVALAHLDDVTETATAARHRALVARRARGEPLAYITGTKEFYSLPLEVTSAVLVPRPETELLVDGVLQRFAHTERPFRVLDLGTGSGAVAIAISHERPSAEVWAVDSSEDALALARRNAERLGVNRVRWVQSDWFAALGDQRFDAIVCNPPYVRSAEAARGALGFEPRLALDGGADGLDSIRALLPAAREHLAASGWLLLEHGFDQRAAVLALAKAAGLALVAARRDLAGHERMVILSGSS